MYELYINYMYIIHTVHVQSVVEHVLTLYKLHIQFNKCTYIIYLLD